MSEENLNVIRRAFDAYARDDIDAVLALCSEDIVVSQAPEIPGVPRHQRGHDGVLAAFDLWPEQWADFSVEIERVLADPAEYVVVSTRQRGRGKQSGIEVDAEFMFVFAVRGGKIAEWRVFIDEDQALAAAGVGEGSEP